MVITDITPMCGDGARRRPPGSEPTRLELARERAIAWTLTPAGAAFHRHAGAAA